MLFIVPNTNWSHVAAPFRASHDYWKWIEGMRKWHYIKLQDQHEELWIKYQRGWKNEAEVKSVWVAIISDKSLFVQLKLNIRMCSYTLDSICEIRENQTGRK